MPPCAGGGIGMWRVSGAGAGFLWCGPGCAEVRFDAEAVPGPTVTAGAPGDDRVGDGGIDGGPMIAAGAVDVERCRHRTSGGDGRDDGRRNSASPARLQTRVGGGSSADRRARPRLIRRSLAPRRFLRRSPPTSAAEIGWRAAQPLPAAARVEAQGLQDLAVGGLHERRPGSAGTVAGWQRDALRIGLASQRPWPPQRHDHPVMAEP